MAPSTAASSSPVERFFEFSLLGLLACGYLAVAGSGFLDLPTIALTGLALVLRALTAAGVFRLHISSRTVAVATLAYACFYPLDYLFFSKQFLPSTVHLVFFLAATRVLTASSNRDYFFVKVIAFLELLAACILSSRLNFFVFLALFLLFAIATFASSEIRSAAGQPSLVVRLPSRGLPFRLASLAVLLSFGIIVITGCLFFLLPRTARAALQHLVPARYHLAGFSSEVSIGEIGEIKKRDTAVMHVWTEDNSPPPASLKWRGAALSSFDGKRWFNAPGIEHSRISENDGVFILADPSQRRRRGNRLTYMVRLSDSIGEALFFAGKPEILWIDGPIFAGPVSGNLRLAILPSSEVTYQAQSFLEDGGAEPRLPDELSYAARLAYLELPQMNPRIAELARAVAAAQPTALAQGQALERHLRRNYAYTLELPQSEPSDPLAWFLFSRKKGHCEYFASAMAVMLRTLGIPSRMVTGFQSGIFNPVSGRQVIRASDAHAWVEAWLPGRGWTVFDPTPPDTNPTTLSLWTRFSFYTDAAEVFWQDWVLNYNLERQRTLATNVGESSRRFRSNWFDQLAQSLATWKTRALAVLSAWWLPIGLLAAAAFLIWSYGPGGWRWWTTRTRVLRAHRGQGSFSDATLLYRRMLYLLRRRGIEKPDWQTPVEFAAVMRDPALALLVEDLTSAYNELRFGGRTEAAGRVARLLQQLEKV